MKFLKSKLALMFAGFLTMLSPAFAVIDTVGVNTAIGVAEASAHTVGTTVIGVIAGLAVVTIVINLVKKM